MNLSTGQVVVIVVAIAAAMFLVTRPETRRRWSDAPPVRRVSIIALGVIAVLAVLVVAGGISGLR